MECKSLGHPIIGITTFTTFVIQQKIYKMFQFHVKNQLVGTRSIIGTSLLVF